MQILSLFEIEQTANEFLAEPNPIDDALKHHCTKLMSYLEHKEELAAFNEEIKSVINDLVDDLDDIRIRNWCLKSKFIFDEMYFPFVLDFLDHTASTDEFICLNVEGYFVKKNDIIDLYVFSKLNWILYFGEYYKAPEKRTQPDPNIDETKGYYYSPPDPNAPTEMEAVKSLVAML